MLQAFKSLLMKSNLLTLGDLLFLSCHFGSSRLVGLQSSPQGIPTIPTATGFPRFPKEPFPLLTNPQHSELRRIWQIRSHCWRGRNG